MGVEHYVDMDATTPAVPPGFGSMEDAAADDFPGLRYGVVEMTPANPAAFNGTSGSAICAHPSFLGEQSDGRGTGQGYRIPADPAYDPINNPPRR